MNLTKTEKTLLTTLITGVLLCGAGLFLDNLIVLTVGGGLLVILSLLFWPELLIPGSGKIGVFDMDQVKNKWIWVGLMWFGLIMAVSIMYFSF